MNTSEYKWLCIQNPARNLRWSPNFRNLLRFPVIALNFTRKESKDLFLLKCLKQKIIFFYQSTIITFFQTKTNNKKLKKFVKKQLRKHYITLLPFVILRQQGITKSTDTSTYSKYYMCICIIRFIWFIADIWNELKFNDSSNFRKQKFTKIYPCFEIKNFQNALILLYGWLKNSVHFYFDFDQIGRNHTEGLWLILLQRA